MKSFFWALCLVFLISKLEGSSNGAINETTNGLFSLYRYIKLANVSIVSKMLDSCNIISILWKPLHINLMKGVITCYFSCLRMLFFLGNSVKMSDDAEYRCFVGGLSWSTSDRVLKEEFEKFGSLVDAKVTIIYAGFSACILLSCTNLQIYKFNQVSWTYHLQSIWQVICIIVFK